MCLFSSGTHLKCYIKSIRLDEEKRSALMDGENFTAFQVSFLRIRTCCGTFQWFCSETFCTENKESFDFCFNGFENADVYDSGMVFYNVFCF